ncbi:DUF4065 domain-containing protein [bacterium LRH843]|nr:DUF4065 domain-containing protein [bacterium LRH843]
MISAYQVANYFLYKSHHDDTARYTISPLKLQKLVYYAEAWYTTMNNNEENLIKEDFEAWVHGPVVPSLYGKYREYGYHQIDKVDSEPLSSLSDKVKNFLDSIWEIYGHFEAKELEKLTHYEDPWKMARNGLPDYQQSNNIITKQSMYDFYKN